MKVLKVKHEKRADPRYTPPKPWVETLFIVEMSEDEYKEILLMKERSKSGICSE